MTRTIFTAIIAAAAITTAAAALAATNNRAPGESAAAPAQLSLKETRDCASQTWPSIDAECLKTIQGQPAGRQFRMVAM